MLHISAKRKSRRQPAPPVDLPVVQSDLVAEGMPSRCFRFSHSVRVETWQGTVWRKVPAIATYQPGIGWQVWRKQSFAWNRDNTVVQTYPAWIRVYHPWRVLWNRLRVINPTGSKAIARWIGDRSPLGNPINLTDDSWQHGKALRGRSKTSGYIYVSQRVKPLPDDRLGGSGSIPVRVYDWLSQPDLFKPDRFPLPA